MVQDNKGIIWIGTYSGLNTYNGLRVEHYGLKPKNLFDTILSGCTIRCLFIDSDNTLWIGTKTDGLLGLNLTNGEQAYFPYTAKSNTALPAATVLNVKELDKSTLLLSTSGGLCSLDKTTGIITLLKHTKKELNILLQDWITSMDIDNKGNLWFGNGTIGLVQYNLNTGKYVRYTQEKFPKQLTGNNVRKIFCDSRGWVWVSYWQTGIVIFKPDSNQIESILNKTPLIENLYKKVSLVSHFFEDKDNNMWFCTAENALMSYNLISHKLSQYSNNINNNESICANNILCGFEDKTGLIWAGSWQSGISYFNPAALKLGHFKSNIGNSKAIHNNIIYSFAQTNNHEVIIGTGENLSFFNTETLEFNSIDLSHATGDVPPNNLEARAIQKYKDGSIWIGSGGSGVYRYYPEENKYKSYVVEPNNPKSLSNQLIIDIIQDSKNRLWLCTYGNGINLYNPETDDFTRFLNDYGNGTGEFVIGATEDALGNIWVSTENDGVFIIDGNTFSLSNPFSKNKEYNLVGTKNSKPHCDSKGFMWLGYGRKLLRINPKNFDIIDYSLINKSLNYGIESIIVDSLNRLWLGTSNGLFRYNYLLNELKKFGYSEGAQGTEYLSASSIQLTNGYILVGGTNGFNYFDPGQFVVNKTEPQITFTDITVLNKPVVLKQTVPFTTELNLTYKDYFFSIEFSAMDFSNSSENLYMYKLEGFNEDWIEINNEHKVTFTNLDPGSYQLLIKACNSQGIWTKEPIAMAINIKPPFWRTKWFYILCLLTIVTSLFSFVKYRENKLTKEKQILESKVAERTHELHNEKRKVEEAHKDIKDSILYAQKIQSAVIPTETEFASIFPNSFVLFLPKDIVSGDFFWINEKRDAIYCAVADCTGHGVPGGFMTMLGSGLLNEIVNEQQISKPNEILNKLREKIISALKQTGKSGENKDGMDIVILKFNKTNNILQYAAANNGFIIINNGIITEYKGDKQPVGIYGSETKPFTSFELTLKSGDTVYTYTDGYPDQFGGPKGKKYKYKQLNEKLLAISHLQAGFQKDKLKEDFEKWKGGLEQVDDVCMVGIKIE